MATPLGQIKTRVGTLYNTFCSNTISSQQARDTYQYICKLKKNSCVRWRIIIKST